MLKFRIITALVLAPAVVFGVLYLDTFWFALLVTVFIGLAAWEWAGIAGYKKLLSRALYTCLLVFILIAIFVYPSNLLSIGLTIVALFWWLAALWLVLRYQTLDVKAFRLPIPAALIGLLVLIPPWLGLIVLRADEPDGVILVLFLLALIWSADIAAYFAGRRWGKNRLCSRVSPGKSREGVYGALAAAVVLALIYAAYRNMQGAESLIFAGICIITVLASILGDLLESLMKRINDIKDSGSILPGHGGVLDRIDSLTAAVPVFFSAHWLCENVV